MWTRSVFLGGLTAAMAAPVLSSTRKGGPQARNRNARMRLGCDTLRRGQSTPNVWIRTTTLVLAGVGYYPANVAIVIDGRESLSIDTGRSDAYANAILDRRTQLREPPMSKALVTHCHFDRTGLAPNIRRAMHDRRS